ncbi:DMT family transporter [Stenotrophomonas mori]|uniref:Guanidinium exporter n=1 Tax=Stenotrophomonas mori TaxID=2871096 RepID=A0ABT0SG62_9GAMM|nr:SMR family transporter [Stenotrophomonas mori]MCL7714308.1 QacE family quaternary ammonium compound efflux SMR transporter [Stenotrophomonas mori]
MGWFLVVAGALMETVGVIGLTRYSGRRSLLNGVLYVGGFAASFVLLYQSFRYLQLSVAYAVWVGLGTAAAVLVGMLFFGESRRPARLLSVAVIVVGVVGLKAVS